jgi:chromosome segregation ATPase
MRKIGFPIFSLLLVVFFACMAFAQVTKPNATAAARLAEQQRIINEISPLFSEFQAIQKDEAQVTKKWDDLKWSEAQIKKQINEHEADGARFEQAAADYDARVTTHNARCNGTFDDASFVNACNAEKNAGDAEKARLQAWAKHLNEMKALLNEAITNHTEQTEKTWAQHKANSARMEEIRAAVQPMLNRLEAIQAEVDACDAAIKNASNEVMHDTCGRMFDGNQ